MSKSNKKVKRSFSSLNRMLIIQLVIMLVLSVFITKTVSDRTKTNAIEHMGAITDERAHIIENYIENAEKTLTAYSKAGQVKELLESPDDAELTKKAQAYTEKFAADIDNLEGIYISRWDTKVLAHSTAAVVGITTREGEPLKQLQDAMLGCGDGVYDTGIIISPASGKQIVSMYKAVYGDNGKPIGLVGLGIFTDGLIDTLDSIPIRGVENSFYSMVNTADNKYIFHTDRSKVTTEADNSDVLSLCSKYKGSSSADTDYFRYKMNGKEYVSIYSYMPDNGWILMIDDSTKEVFALTRTMIIYLGIFGVTILGLIIVFNSISKKQEQINEKLLSTIAKSNQAKQSLNTAMFKDVLTDVNNRVSFAMDVDKFASSEAGRDYYFAMFNISSFSDINTDFGVDAGDSMLVRMVNILKEAFPGKAIYRTGSDEFIIAAPVDASTPTDDLMLDTVNSALRQLMVPEDFGDKKTIYPKYKVAVLRISAANINSSVVSILKDMTNKKGEAYYGMIDYRDMS